MSVAEPEVASFGCRLNLVEGEAIGRLLAGRDVAVVNTCGVTNEAVRQARQAIRRLRRERPSRAIFVTGCAAEMERETFAGMPEIDGLVPNGLKTQPGAWALPSPTPRQSADEKPSPLEESTASTRAFLAIQNGCDHACTFCAIPRGRGAARSAPTADVVARAESLVARGFAEIVLTGVDLTSWGGDLPERPRLGALVRAILREVPALRRLRLSSIDCIETDADLLAAFAEEPRLMPYLHLSLQSGDDLVLKRMKRRHSRAEAVAVCATLRRLRPDMAFGADLIAGFPTETEAMAASTRALVEDCGLAYLHVFPFSPRPGTPAARMPQVAPALVRERAARLREAGDAALRRHLAARRGRSCLCSSSAAAAATPPTSRPSRPARFRPAASSP
ncbi:Threonylcarbamoyladenosine tRNA methylthiotransferase MtaB [Beijerinckiaceae bacterium RH AL1]|nr:Threonylcarbamoyladenosine tRNA methylthiotransferase MtaB [Beijerinckiaceae bacterium RH AL1]